jgi:hypothetical protein
MDTHKIRGVDSKGNKLASAVLTGRTNGNPKTRLTDTRLVSNKIAERIARWEISDFRSRKKICVRIELLLSSPRRWRGRAAEG